MRPGPLRLALENRADVRVLPAVWIAGEVLHNLLSKRRPFLTAKRLLTNQTFRDIYRTDTLDVDQRLKITSLTFLFTDLKGSTELYERVGDLVAYDLVRGHFRILNEIIAAEAGAVVKTIGDAVMATFPTPDRAIAAALRMRDAMSSIKQGDRDLLLKIRNPRGTMPRGDGERSARLFWSDGEHRLACSGTCCLALDFRDRTGRRASRFLIDSQDQQPGACAAAHVGARYRGRARGVRDPVEGAFGLPGASASSHSLGPTRTSRGSNAYVRRRDCAWVDCPGPVKIGPVSAGWLFVRKQFATVGGFAVERR
jgi:hypothetical protein